MTDSRQEGTRLVVDLLNVDGNSARLTVHWAGGSQEVEISLARNSQVTFEIPEQGNPLAEVGVSLELRDAEDRVYQSQILTVVEPVRLPDHPLLALNQADINTLLPRYQSEGRASNVLGSLVGACAQRLPEPVEVPLVGGAWSALYSCPVHGATLTYLSDIEHQCPVDEVIYTGSPYNEVVVSIRHRDYAHQAFDHGVAWILTGNIQHARRVRDILDGYALAYPNYDLHDKHGGSGPSSAKVFPQTLDEAEWLIELARGWDLIRGSGVSSEEQRQRIQNDLFAASADLIAGHEVGIHNIQCWHNSAILLANLLAQRFPEARKAIHGDVGLLKQMEEGVLSDGLWHEGSFGYHFYAIRGLLPALQAIRRIEHTLDYSSLVEMLKSPYAAMLPPGTLPLLNDGGEQDFTNSLSEVYEQGVGLFTSNPELATPLLIWGRGNTVESILYGPKNLKNWEWEDLESGVFGESGISVMHSGSPQQRSTALVDYGPHGSGHGHPDKLGLTLWLEGQPVFVEAGSIGYGTGLYRGWYKRTLAHNLLVRDGVNQEECAGELVRFESDQGTSTTVVKTSAAYPGSTLTRLSHLTETGVMADLLRVESTEEHIYDYVLHGAGTATLSIPTNPGNLLYGGPYRYIKDVVEADVNTDFEVVFKTDVGSQTLHVMGEVGTRVYLGRAPGHPAGSDHPVLIVRRRTQSTSFASVVTSGTELRAGVSLALSTDGKTLELMLPSQAEAVSLPLEMPAP
jgi:hypothetical protein